MEVHPREMLGSDDGPKKRGGPKPRPKTGQGPELGFPCEVAMSPIAPVSRPEREQIV